VALSQLIFRDKAVPITNGLFFNKPRGAASELRNMFRLLKNDPGIVGRGGPRRLVLIHDPRVRPIGYARAAALAELSAMRRALGLPTMETARG